MKNALRILFLLMVLGGFIFIGDASALLWTAGDAWVAQHRNNNGLTNEYFVVIKSLGINTLKVKKVKFEPMGVERNFSELTGLADNNGVTWFQINNKRTKMIRKSEKKYLKMVKKRKINPTDTTMAEYVNQRLTGRKFKAKINGKKMRISFATFWNDEVPVDEQPPGNNTAPVPEPATMLLLGSGLVGIAAAGRKKLFKK